MNTKPSLVEFVEKYLGVRSADGAIVPFVLNEAQRRVLETMSVDDFRRRLFISGRRGRVAFQSTLPAALSFWAGLAAREQGPMNTYTITFDGKRSVRRCFPLEPKVGGYIRSGGVDWRITRTVELAPGKWAVDVTWRE